MTLYEYRLVLKTALMPLAIANYLDREIEKAKVLGDTVINMSLDDARSLESMARETYVQIDHHRNKID